MIYKKSGEEFLYNGIMYQKTHYKQAFHTYHPNELNAMRHHSCGVQPHRLTPTPSPIQTILSVLELHQISHLL